MNMRPNSQQEDKSHKLFLALLSFHVKPTDRLSSQRPQRLESQTLNIEVTIRFNSLLFLSISFIFEIMIWSDNFLSPNPS